jgi:hypothetical protein
MNMAADSRIALNNRMGGKEGVEWKKKRKARQAKPKQGETRQHRARQDKGRGAASGIDITPKTEAKARQGEAT